MKAAGIEEFEAQMLLKRVLEISQKEKKEVIVR